MCFMVFYYRYCRIGVCFFLGTRMGKYDGGNRGGGGSKSRRRIGIKCKEWLV